MSFFTRAVLASVVFAGTGAGCTPTFEGQSIGKTPSSAYDSHPSQVKRLEQQGRLLPTFASTLYPAGNPTTLRFLEWSRTIHPDYASAKLNSEGDCIDLSTHPCYPVRDEELAEIANLDRLESLTIYSGELTDSGLLYLAKAPSLKELRLGRTIHVTNAGLEHLRRLKPRLQIELRRRQTVSSVAFHASE